MTDSWTLGEELDNNSTKTTPVDADEITLLDSAEATAQNKATGVGYEAYRLTYFDKAYE